MPDIEEDREKIKGYLSLFFFFVFRLGGEL